MAEQERLLEFFQRQEAERARAASAAAAAAPPAPSAPHLQPPALLPQLPLDPQAASVTGAAGAVAPLTQQLPGYGVDAYPAQQQPLSANAMPGFADQTLPAVHQQQQQQQLLTHQAAAAGRLTFEGYGAGSASPGRQPAMQPQQQQQLQYHQQLLLSRVGLPRGQPAHQEYSSSPPGWPAQLPESPVLPRAVVIPGPSMLHDPGSRFNLGGSPVEIATSTIFQDYGATPIPRPQPDPPSEGDGMRQLQALMAAVPQFAFLAARLDKVGAHGTACSFAFVRGGCRSGCVSLRRNWGCRRVDKRLKSGSGWRQPHVCPAMCVTEGGPRGLDKPVQRRTAR